MRSNRGRKRNDNLPPDRTREYQRAFRARRAAHLQVCTLFTIDYYLSNMPFDSCQALEQRVLELEEDNRRFRHALSLPPSNQSSLGRGPTGRDLASQEVERFHSQTTSLPSSGLSASSNMISSALPSSTVSIPSRTRTMVRTGPSPQKNSILLSDGHPELEVPPLHSRILHLPDSPTTYYSPTSESYHLPDHRSTLRFFGRDNHPEQHDRDSHPSYHVLHHHPPERGLSPQSHNYPWYHATATVLPPPGSTLMAALIKLSKQRYPLPGPESVSATNQPTNLFYPQHQCLLILYSSNLRRSAICDLWPHPLHALPDIFSPQPHPTLDLLPLGFASEPGRK